MPRAVAPLRMIHMHRGRPAHKISKCANATSATNKPCVCAAEQAFQLTRRAHHTFPEHSKIVAGRRTEGMCNETESGDGRHERGPTCPGKQGAPGQAQSWPAQRATSHDWRDMSARIDMVRRDELAQCEITHQEHGVGERCQQCTRGVLDRVVRGWTHV